MLHSTSRVDYFIITCSSWFSFDSSCAFHAFQNISKHEMHFMFFHSRSSFTPSFLWFCVMLKRHENELSRRTNASFVAYINFMVFSWCFVSFFWKITRARSFFNPSSILPMMSFESKDLRARGHFPRFRKRSFVEDFLFYFFFFSSHIETELRGNSLHWAKSWHCNTSQSQLSIIAQATNWPAQLVRQKFRNMQTYDRAIRFVLKIIKRLDDRR